MKETFQTTGAILVSLVSFLIVSKILSIIDIDIRFRYQIIVYFLNVALAMMFGYLAKVQVHNIYEDYMHKVLTSKSLYSKNQGYETCMDDLRSINHKKFADEEIKQIDEYGDPVTKSVQMYVIDAVNLRRKLRYKLN